MAWRAVGVVPATDRTGAQLEFRGAVEVVERPSAGFLQELKTEPALDAALGDLDEAAMNRDPQLGSDWCSPNRRINSTSVPA
jgi:hypothetical protein